MPNQPGDGSGLRRSLLTRWLPVLLQAEASPPVAAPYPVAENTTTGRFLFRVLFSATRLTIPAAILAVLWQVGEAMVPIIAGAAIDRALATGDLAELLMWLAILAANFLTLSLSYRFASQLSARATLSSSVLHPGRSTPLAVWLMGILSRHYARTSRSYQTFLADTVGQATDLVSGYRVRGTTRSYWQVEVVTHSCGRLGARDACRQIRMPQAQSRNDLRGVLSFDMALLSRTVAVRHLLGCPLAQRPSTLPILRRSPHGIRP